MKIFMFFINTIYWLWLFIVPAGVLSFVAYCLYAKDPSNKTIAIVIAIAGILLGIYFAEKIRKKYGLSNFFGSLAGGKLEEKKEEDGLS